MSEVTEQKPKTCTVLIRARTPDGFEAEVTFDEVPRAGASDFITAVSAAMKGHGFTAMVSAASKATTEESPMCETCGGPTEYKTGKKQNGQAWAGYFCKATAKAEKDLQHKPKWVTA